MLVSIITPYYSNKEFIIKTVNSVLLQTYKNWELIIVDDENSHESKLILNNIKKINPNKVNIFSTKKNSGAATARNLGIKKSNGSYIAFLDSDDYWKKNKLEKQILELKKKKADLVYTNYSVFNVKNNTLRNIYCDEIINYDELLKNCPICCSSVLLKKNILKKIKFRNYKTKEDYDLWLRLIKKNYKFICVKNFLTFYTKKKKSLSSNHFNNIINAYKIYKYNFGSKPIKIIYFIIVLYLNAFKKNILNI
jgi:teichuronic acid biosynthesis glycosyltransferase TuaG